MKRQVQTEALSEHHQDVKEYICENYPDWDIEKSLYNGVNVEICSNGDVHYDSFIIIKTNIKES